MSASWRGHREEKSHREDQQKSVVKYHALECTSHSLRRNFFEISHLYPPPSTLIMAETALRGDGIAHVKAEYIIPKTASYEVIDDDAAERQTNPASKIGTTDGEEQLILSGEAQDDEYASKRPKLSGAARKQAKRQENRKAHRGQNKERKFGNIRDQVILCCAAARGKQCTRNE